MEERGIQKAILVVQSPLTAFAREAIADVAPKHLIEYFLESELLVSLYSKRISSGNSNFI